MSGRHLILGCGYVGERLARRLHRGGARVTGSTRDPRRARQLEEAGIRAVLLDVETPGWRAGLADLAPKVCWYLIPPIGDRPDADHPAAALRALAGAGLRRFVYGSSTGVYGDRGGVWVDESETPRPDSGRGAARMAAERAALAAGARTGVAACVVRIAGIYGPGRVLSRARRRGYVEVRRQDTWSNRIHVDDLVEALVLVGRRGEAGAVYNACDDHPHASGDFARLAAKLLGLEVSEVSGEAGRRRSAARAARAVASRRVSNRRLRELGLHLRHPDYRSGVPAALEEERRG